MDKRRIPSFHSWVKSQKGELSPGIDDLIDDIVGDRGFPRRSRRYLEVRNYLENCDACWQALGRLNDAWKVYIADHPEVCQPEELAECGVCYSAMCVCECHYCPDCKQDESECTCDSGELVRGYELLEYRQTREQRIYFIRSEGEDIIKIGVSRNPKSRLRQLSTSSPKKLELLLSFQGSSLTEQRLHEKFKYQRLNGEWFRIDDEMRKYLRGLGIKNLE